MNAHGGALSCWFDVVSGFPFNLSYLNLVGIDRSYNTVHRLKRFVFFVLVFDILDVIVCSCACVRFIFTTCFLCLLMPFFSLSFSFLIWRD